jgi:hypothetical protein
MVRRVKFLLLGAIASTIILLFTAAQVIIPKQAETMLQKAIQDSLTSYEEVNVTVKSFPAFEILLGRVDRLSVSATMLSKDDIRIHQAEIDLKGLKFYVGKGSSNKGFTVRSVDNGEAYVILTEEDLNEYISSQLGGTRSITVELTKGEGIIRGLFDIAGTSIELAINGEFQPAGSGLVFRPRGLKVQDTYVPRDLVDEILNTLNLRLDLSKLPFPLSVTSVKPHEGKLEVRAETRLYDSLSGVNGR